MAATKTAEVILAEQALTAAQARQAEQKKQEQRAQYQELARQHRAAQENVHRLKAQFDRAESTVATCFQAALTAESALQEHNARAAGVEFPTEEEMAAAGAKRAQLEATLGQKRTAVLLAKQKRDAIRLDCANEDGRRQQLERTLRNAKAVLEGDELGSGWKGGVFGLEDGRELKL
ncbi:MAG: hypothetical protein ACHP78_03880 [Terriglobales bacterium]